MCQPFFGDCMSGCVGCRNSGDRGKMLGYLVEDCVRFVILAGLDDCLHKQS